MSKKNVTKAPTKSGPSNKEPTASAQPLAVDEDYLQRMLLKMLSIHSPSGYTDPIIRELCHELDQLGLKYEMTRRGAVRATLPGRAYSPDRAIVAHVDTLGAMVKCLKPNGRLQLVSVGTWSARFAEGARVSVYTDETVYRGTILPLKASGHVYNEEVDTQPGTWDNLELRLDQDSASQEDLEKLGCQIGDFVGVDSQAEFLANGYLNARHLDDKAGVATMLAAAKYLNEHQIELPVECHLLFTISEEVGSGASAILHGDVAELVSIDNGTCAPGQNSQERGATIAMADSTGPFDFHLTHHLLNLCKKNEIAHQRDIFKYYRCDSASALEAGNDIRTALVTFGLDASHGYERTHLDALTAVTRLIIAYAQSPLIYKKQKKVLTSIKDFPEVRVTDVELTQLEQTESTAQVPPPERLAPKAK
ncbi:osmoprotectant NAGGN system M42 family peptidase [Cerasicoccus arenae]|uniref:Peptidase M42 n=1 Tax=Cerasicoccus arenae TaxID=424488 RepID=A0A8J3DEF1_9BACT|nr:osmoprotectant NAGGN system M42 family peptidase [Cerasicoccus arenae]MBK1857871.1 osmoprotectant NAGGN system M42 family peptidase [Cerasicoccus arenae]GHC09369.1 peptidase M42 [Cerasicoccus arenae]